MLRNLLLLCSVAGLVLGPSTAYAIPPIDLTTAATTLTSSVDDVVWSNTLLFQATGTGGFDPFLRVHDQQNYGGTPLGVEEGMNTDGARLYEQLGGGDPHTHAIQFGELQIENIGGQDYYVFTLDFAEPTGQDFEFLTIEELRMHSVDEAAGGALTTEADVIGAAGSIEHYDLDQTQNQTVFLDYTVSNQGNGQSDIDFYIPVSYFAGATDSDYFYTYIKFGRADTFEGVSWAADGSFEELRVLTKTGGRGNAPEPGTIALFGIGLAGLAVGLRKNKK
ncbi:MAG TPA: PEP-CTERM sorting domain-containing protein [Candidatus Eisenbacteria bacterium]|nr:PEP-CTERM sorting domain-containing protein [Candidatus Eisenbacteria bacterium]